jgi:hypothetical protein
MPTLAQVLVLLAAATAPPDEVDDVRSSLLAVGDVDGDGVPDVLLASRPAADAEKESGPSALRVLSGTDLSDVICIPQDDCGGFGRALAAAGDLDADGFVDVLVAGNGRVVALTFADSNMLFELDVPDWEDELGMAIAGGRDLDADGFPDVALSAACAVFPAASPVFLHAGPAGRPLGRLDPGDGTARGARRQAYGVGLALLPDLDEDGGAEIAVGVPQGGGRRGDASRVPPKGYVDVRDHEGHRLLRIEAAAGDDGPYFGWGLSLAGDADADGSPDLAISAPSSAVAVHSLADGARLWSRDYEQGYMLSEGSSLGAVGDVDGDGLDDLVVGANETGIDCDPGGVWILSGAGGATLAHHDPGPPPPGAGSSGFGPCFVGVDVEPVGDVDGDGIRDVAAHAPRARRVDILSGDGLRPIATRSTASIWR